MSANPIQKIGRYEIEREIGRGGMAIVYKAFDPRLERPVAIKLIQTDAFATNAFGHVRERFEREAKALARLDHPNILKVYDYGEHKGAPYLVMDYIEGSTLKELKKPIRVDTAVKLLTPIADALEYVHAQGLLHRDVKPSNIMITRRGHVILTDFGIVKSLEDDGELHTLTATGVGIGTPEYMSPEQGRGMKVDARSDMYSLSIVFYELITGRKPFTADTPVNVLLKQISEPLPDPRQFVEEISESVKKFLDRAAAKDPEDRYPTTKEYLLDFEGLRLQAQTNRAMGQTSNSGFQSLPRKTETTSASLEIGKTDLAKVRAESDTGSPTITSLMKRTFLFLEDGNWATADAYCERVLDCDPEYGMAYLAKLMAKLKIQRVEALGKLSEPFDDETLYEKAVRFGDDELREKLEEMNRTIRARIQEEEKQRESSKKIAEAARKKRKRGLIWVAAVVVLILGLFGLQLWRKEMARREQVRVWQTQDALATQEQIRVLKTQDALATQEAKYQVGNIIRFGRYEQDNNLSNGAEEIEWRVLAIEGNTALIVSVMGLDAKPYHEPGGAITWEKCTLRAWLNNEFYNAAFNEAERAKIERTHVVNEKNTKYSTEGGNDTEDDVFLLSIAEAEKYFRDSEDRKIKPTKYAIANGAYTNRNNGNGWWWHRSPGYYLSRAAVVFSGGGVISNGDDVDGNDASVRPALRINLLK